MIVRKQAIVDQTSGGVKYLMENKVTVLKVCLLLTLLMLLLQKPTELLKL
jgi:hypothetical protein